MIAEKFEKIREINERKSLILAEEKEQIKPILENKDRIGELYERFKEVANPKNLDNTRIFIFIVFFIYSPSSFFHKGIKGGVRKRIASVLKKSNVNVSFHFSNALFLFDNSKSFRKETERIYKLLSVNIEDLA